MRCPCPNDGSNRRPLFTFAARVISEMILKSEVLSATVSKYLRVRFAESGELLHASARCVFDGIPLEQQ